MVSVRRTVEVEEQVRALMAEALDDRESGPGPACAGKPARAATARIRGRREQRRRSTRSTSATSSSPASGTGASSASSSTNACRYSCDYCPMRAERDLPRHALEPARLARLFMTAFRRGWCDGLFITSGIPKDAGLGDGPDARARRAPARHARIPRLPARQGSRGRASRDRSRSSCASSTASRTTSRCLASARSTSTPPARSSTRGSRSSRSRATRAARRGARQRARASARKAPPVAPLPPRPVRVPGGMGAGATTQFVVGLGNESDRELLSFAEGLEKKKLIHHAQFAAFRPISGHAPRGRPETPALRERRLYEADHLLRQYGFSADELPYGKTAISRSTRTPSSPGRSRHPERFPSSSRPRRARSSSAFRASALARSSASSSSAGARPCAIWAISGASASASDGRPATWTLRGKLLGTRVTQEPSSRTSIAPLQDLTISVRARFAEPRGAAVPPVTSEVVTPCARIRVCIWPSLPPPPPRFSRTSGPFWRPAPTRKSPRENGKSKGAACNAALSRRSA